MLIFLTFSLLTVCLLDTCRDVIVEVNYCFTSLFGTNGHLSDIAVVANYCFMSLFGTVVVNHCFTSLFGTNGILSEIVIR